MEEETARGDGQAGGRLAIPDPELLELDRHAALGSLMGAIAHEALNPLAAALNLALLVRELLHAPRQARAEQLAELLENLAGELRRGCAVLSQVQEFFLAGEAGRCVPCDLNRIAEEALALVRHRTRLAGVPLEVRLNPGLPAVRCRPALIRQAVLGLLVHAGPQQDGREGISLATAMTGEGREALVEVRGAWNGGAAAELAMEAARRIARAHGGRVEVESGPAGRSVRRLVLPLGDDADEETLGDPGRRR